MERCSQHVWISVSSYRKHAFVATTLTRLHRTRNSTHNQRRAAGQGYNEQPDQYQGQEMCQPIRPESSMSNYHQDTNFTYGNNPFPGMASVQGAVGYGFSFYPPSFTCSPMTEVPPPVANPSGPGGMAYATTSDAGNTTAMSAGGDFDMDTVSSSSGICLPTHYSGHQLLT